MVKKYERINKLISQEYSDISNTINLIGSANYPFPEVLKALSSAILIKAAEGFPEKIFFPQCENLDDLEKYGEILVKNFFNISNLNYNVSLQPHSGTQANQIVFNGILNPGDKILSLKTDCGGHISHASFPKKYFNLVEYGINNNEFINYNEIESSFKITKPKLLIAGTSSYPRQFNYDILGDICKKNDIKLLADISHTASFIATNNHISPFNNADFVTLSTNKTTRGTRGGVIIYSDKFKKKIERSIFPISQGSPKFNDILAKVVMFTELQNINIYSYVQKIMYFSQNICWFLLNKNIDVFTRGTDSHLVIINLQKHGMTGIECERSLEMINILVNRNLIPNDFESPLITSGIRLGFLTLATLNFSFEDFEKLIQIIYDQLFTKNKHTNNEVIKIIRKYNIISNTSVGK